MRPQRARQHKNGVGTMRVIFQISDTHKRIAVLFLLSFLALC